MQSPFSRTPPTYSHRGVGSSYQVQNHQQYLQDGQIHAALAPEPQQHTLSDPAQSANLMMPAEPQPTAIYYMPPQQSLNMPYERQEIKMEKDDRCNPKIVQLFLEFAKDYYHVVTASQRDYHMGGSWEEFVDTFSNRPITHALVLKLSQMMSCKDLVTNKRKRGRKKRDALEIDAAGTGYEQSVLSGRNENAEKGQKEENLETVRGSSICLVPSCLEQAVHNTELCETHMVEEDCGLKMCYQRATHAFVMGEPPKMCREHAFDGMIRVKGKRASRNLVCAEMNCTAKATVSFDGKKKYCTLHKESIANDKKLEKQKKKVCRHIAFTKNGRITCRKNGVYYFEGDETFRYCKEHSKQGMLRTGNSYCQHISCYARAMYSFPEATEPERCSRHREPGMTKLTGRCERPGCGVVAFYNYPGELHTKRFCNSHKLPGMVRCVKNVCVLPGCARPASYAFEGKEVERCRFHAVEGMRYALEIPAARRCAYPGCHKRKHYKFKDQSDGVFCSEHKLPGMVPSSQVCQHEGCLFSAFFNYPGLKVRRFCKAHMLEGMVPAKPPKTNQTRRGKYRHPTGIEPTTLRVPTAGGGAGPSAAPGVGAGGALGPSGGAGTGGGGGGGFGGPGPRPPHRGTADAAAAPDRPPAQRYGRGPAAAAAAAAPARGPAGAGGVGRVLPGGAGHPSGGGPGLGLLGPLGRGGHHHHHYHHGHEGRRRGLAGRHGLGGAALGIGGEDSRAGDGDDDGEEGYMHQITTVIL